jgi:glycosyltransferase involved in cell wall biosynthesis
MRKKITVYHYLYLPLTETFIYRQFQGLQSYFDLKILTHGLDNRKEFPLFEPAVAPRGTSWMNLLQNEDRFFSRHLRGSNLFHVNFGHVALHMQDHAAKAGIPMTVYFLGVDASACLNNKEYRDELSKSTFAAVFVNSEDMKKRLASYLPKGMKCHVAYCGVPLEQFPFKLRVSVPRGASFLQVSRLEAKKGVDVTLRAFSRYVHECDPHACLIIAGDGPLKIDLMNLAASLKLNQQVTFLGYIGGKKYVELLQSADVFLHPSLTAEDGDMEGLPTAVIDAMACGLPVISTFHSGIPEIIDDGINGFLAKEGDSEGLLSRMKSLRHIDIESVSRKARVKIEEKFDSEKNIAYLARQMNGIMTGN